MYLGNIVLEKDVSDKIINDISKNGLFKITDDFNDINKDIPTLIIGWDLSKKIFSERKLSILDKKIDKNTNWTFSKDERRVDYEKDLNFFIKKALILVQKRVKYRYFNVLTENLINVKKLIKKLTSDEVFYIYIYNNSFIYLYVDKTIIGIDFNTIDFLKIDRKKIYKILYSNNNKLIFDYNFLTKKIIENIDNNYKIIPYLYSVKNE